MFEELTNEEMMEFDGGGLIKFLLGATGALGCLAGAAICIPFSIFTNNYAPIDNCGEAGDACIEWALSDGYYIW